MKFTKWSLPSCPDGSTKGECCKQGPHVLVSKTGYAKKLSAFCGPEAPKFEKSDFEKGKARWLVVFNNTGSNDDTQLEMESPTIGYRSKISKTQTLKISVNNVKCFQRVLHMTSYTMEVVVRFWYKL